MQTHLRLFNPRVLGVFHGLPMSTAAVSPRRRPGLIYSAAGLASIPRLVGAEELVHPLNEGMYALAGIGEGLADPEVLPVCHVSS